MGKAKGDEQYTLYRREGDPRLQEHNDQRQHQSATDGRAKPESKPVDWPAKAKALSGRLGPEERTELAEALGLPVACLDELPLLGYDRANREQDERGEGVTRPCWTFPEVDGAGVIIGVNRRYNDGRKKLYAGGKRGLTVPERWAERDGPIYLPEGASDVLALMALGLAAVGRPNNTGGVEHLAQLLRTVSNDRPIVVLGEYDSKPNGTWPGRDGAVKVASELAAKLNRPVGWALPPGKAKDVRRWVLDQRPDVTLSDEWCDLGDRFRGALAVQLIATEGGEETTTAPGPRFHFVTSAEFAATKCNLDWHVEQILAKGQPAVVGGPHKSLKTSLLVDLAISLGTGMDFLATSRYGNRVAWRSCLVRADRAPCRRRPSVCVPPRALSLPLRMCCGSSRFHNSRTQFTSPPSRTL
jgi:hypothetical protein